MLDHHHHHRFSEELDRATNFAGARTLEFDDTQPTEEYGYICVRKDESELSDEEKYRFKKALQLLIDRGDFEAIVTEHTHMTEYRMHGWNDDRLGLNRFLSWHRKYLTEFEKLLGKADIELTGTENPIGLPYWRWSKNRTFPGWLVDVIPLFGSGGPGTEPETRANGHDVGSSAQELPEKDHVLQLLENFFDLVPDMEEGLNTYERFTYCLEGYAPNLPAHNHVHVWVGGVMNSQWSPADPIFWLHHCEIDRLWSIWQSSYPDSHPRYSKRALQLLPWSDTNYYSVLDTEAVGYIYDTLEVDFREI